jgi:hypothetical protein
LEYGGMIEMVCVTPPSQGKRYGRDEYPSGPDGFDCLNLEYQNTGALSLF